jgi:tRNA(Ile)-lysidine synthase
MTDKVLKYIKEQHMLKEGDLVVAGVSGGADSVCLLFVLLEVMKTIPIDLHVVHINHMIREDAGNDAQYVEQLCISNNIPFTLVEKDVEAIAKHNHISTEEAGRNVRYEAFYKTLGNREGKIAIAHNKNDCCETFLFNLFRGSSLKGLAGIRATRDKIIRPLLCLERSEIELFLQERHIHYCTDSTNLGDDYTRNKIRHHILEKAVTDISPAAVGNISNACEKINEAYALISDLTAEAFDKCVTTVNNNKIYKKAYHIDEGEFRKVHDTIKGYVIMEVLSQTAGSAKDLESVHVNDVKALFDRQCGRQLDLPYAMTAKRDYTGITVYIKARENNPDTKFHQITLTDEQRLRLQDGEEIAISLQNNDCLLMKIFDNSEKIKNSENIPQKKYTKWFDYDKIKGSIAIRTRKIGDYLTVNSMNQRKTIKSYFIDEKISKDERDNMLLLADESHIMWVIGARISNYYKVSGDTAKILCVTYIHN